MVSEFQGFARDLHGVAADVLVSAVGVDAPFLTLMTEGLTLNRGLDRGNATLRTIKDDFRRLGLSPLNLGGHDQRWSLGDSVAFQDLFELRNAIAHGNEQSLARLRSSRGVLDTVVWARPQLIVLNRVATGLDRAVWDHLKALIRRDPWRE